jgi:hypothetical protein
MHADINVPRGVPSFHVRGRCQAGIGDVQPASCLRGAAAACATEGPACGAQHANAEGVGEHAALCGPHPWLECCLQPTKTALVTEAMCLFSGMQDNWQQPTGLCLLHCQGLADVKQQPIMMCCSADCQAIDSGLLVLCTSMTCQPVGTNPLAVCSIAFYTVSSSPLARDTHGLL